MFVVASKQVSIMKFFFFFFFGHLKNCSCVVVIFFVTLKAFSLAKFSRFFYHIH